MYKLEQGDCLELLKHISDSSIDSIVTDPPYGLSNHKTSEVIACLSAWIQGQAYQPKGKGFMGKSWDAWVPGPEIWKECLRVLKPGGHLLAFAGTRSMDLMSMAIRLAGFELRDSIGFAHDGDGAPLLAWCHGSGFPKNMNIPGKIDDTESAKEWEGWGTGLKPAWEPIMIARKPVEGTVADNVLKYGTGGLNIEACRVGDSKRVPGSLSNRTLVYNGGWGKGTGKEPGHNPDIGRHPTNVIHDGSDKVMNLFPETKSGGGRKAKRNYLGSGQSNSLSGKRSDSGGKYWDEKRQDWYTVSRTIDDSGSAARFFYCAKASPRDRNEGCEGLPLKSSGECTDRKEGSAGLNNARAGAGRTSGNYNHHPTVKPTKLLQYLIKLVTPPGGVILDPFCGSGSTGKAAMLDGFDFIGIEQNPEYIEIARARIEYVVNQGRQLKLDL